MFQNVLVFAPVTKRQATNIQLLIIKLRAVDELRQLPKKHTDFNLPLWKLLDDDDEVIIK